MFCIALGCHGIERGLIAWFTNGSLSEDFTAEPVDICLIMPPRDVVMDEAVPDNGTVLIPVYGPLPITKGKARWENVRC